MNENMQRIKTREREEGKSNKETKTLNRKKRGGGGGRGGGGERGGGRRGGGR